MPHPVNERALHPETRLVHEGGLRSQFGETSEALFLTQGHVYPSAEECEARFKGESKGFIYARSNPTVTMFERRIAAFEGAEAARATASGMAAVTASLMGQLRAGDHVVASRALFGSCRYVIAELLPRFGVALHPRARPDPPPGGRRSGRRPRSLPRKPGQPDPGGHRHRRRRRHRQGGRATLVVDNASSPIWQKPFELGADCVVYSATKHIDGQGRCLGGVILASEAFIQEHVHTFLRQTGPALSPFNAWVLLKSSKPCRSASSGRPARPARSPTPRRACKITRLIYPGRPDHPQADIIARQMRGGSNLIASRSPAARRAAFRLQNALRLIQISNNLGDAKSLITHPATTTHQRFTPEERAEMGVSDGLVRLSVGLEHPGDLIADLMQALEQA